MNVVNSEEVSTWLFEHAVNQGHRCDGIKAYIGLDDYQELVNVEYVDRTTNERIKIDYEN